MPFGRMVPPPPISLGVLLVGPPLAQRFFALLKVMGLIVANWSASDSGCLFRVPRFPVLRLVSSGSPSLGRPSACLLSWAALPSSWARLPVSLFWVFPAWPGRPCWGLP